MTNYSLPVELWLKVFSHFSLMTDLLQCSLVCTYWKQMAESHIFSRNIMVKRNWQTRALQTYLLGHMNERHALKHINIGRQDKFTLEMESLLFLAITSSLETLDGTMMDDRFFHVLLVIIENDLTETKLKTIPTASTYSTTYDSILLHLKDSLEEIQLNFKEDPDGGWAMIPPPNLEQMTHLRSLSICSDIHTIFQIDRMLTSCNHLEMLTIHMSLVSGTGRDREFDAWVAEDVRKNVTVKTLRVRYCRIYDLRLIDYLMNKYQKLETIAVERLPHDTWKTFNSPELILSMEEITILLSRIEAVPNYIVQCVISETKAKQILRILKLWGYIASFGRRHIVDSFTTRELCIRSSHHLITNEVCRSVKIAPELYMS